MINCYAEVRNVQVKPNDTVEIKLVVDVDELSGQNEELMKLVGREVNTSLESNQISYREKVDPETREPVLKYMVHKDGTVAMYSQEKLDLELEELPAEERSSVINKSEIDEYILACEGIAMTIPGGIFEGKEVLQKLSEGEDIEDLARFYGTPVKEMQDTLDEYRKFVAAKAKAWQDWKNNSEQTADSEEQESENDGQATLEFETEE
ncbi:hypothetical protein AF226_14910 [Listeria monocytogenes]|uniref:Lin1249 protein n=1 Tax=Listeria innocua serovar 6a (strain ATCC BAA-680 / CLIP 11262) TaxID=272626 RepID=Q925X8_LISIN|nr:MULTISPECIES: hypothetical protein [Listeria]AWN08018.1 hypothetical protein [Listeria phage PSU-VKH-LP041]EAC2216481.1 hypothetical protein [Listeria monocytogenes]EAC2936028.1 hypothetical protein [Listeria monocytogenes]EAC3184251.1 hypothetical protein [Listeria monocytogenes]EAC3480350.1 hypothetical protein [Listeria monocytogenes]